MTEEQIKILAEQSIRDGEQRYTEEQIRSMVGAPSKEESETCLCGRSLLDFPANPECYIHMSKGY